MLLIQRARFIKLRKSNEIKKVILCSGKIYFDLLEAREKQKSSIVFYRIEQLYPFPARSLVKELMPCKKGYVLLVRKNPKIWEHGFQLETISNGH